MRHNFSHPHKLTCFSPFFLFLQLELWLTGTLQNASFRSTNIGEWGWGANSPYVIQPVCSGRKRYMGQPTNDFNSFKRVSSYTQKVEAESVPIVPLTIPVLSPTLPLPYRLVGKPRLEVNLTRTTQSSITTQIIIRELYAVIPKATDQEVLELRKKQAHKQKKNPIPTTYDLYFWKKHKNVYTLSIYLPEAM